MAKIKITETNGATAEDISAAIGQFLAERGKAAAEQEKPAEAPADKKDE